jgi:hypothetical protein
MHRISITGDIMKTKSEAIFKLVRWSVTALLVVITALPTLSSVSGYA